MIGKEFRVQFLTSTPIDKVEVIRRIADFAQALSDEPVTVLGYQDRNNRYKTVEFGEQEIERILKTITESDSLGSSGMCELKGAAKAVTNVTALSWVYPKRQSLTKFVKDRGFPQNTITLRVPIESLAKESYTKRLVSSCGELARDIAANYGRGWCHEDEVERPRIQSGGITAGLPNIYWLNIFGSAFVDLIGSQRLDQLDHVTSFGNVRVVLASDKYRAGDLASVRQSRERLRAAIGDEYVAEVESPSPAKAGQSTSGLFSFLVSAVREKRSFASHDGEAKKRPNIDWYLFDEERDAAVARPATRST